MTEPSGSVAERVEALTWYHTIDLPGGIVTPGRYDLRSVLSRLPMPMSLEGKRCLDVGTRDGFYAFEMERRGARDVVALDLDDPEQIQLPLPRPGRHMIREDLENGRRAFSLAHGALGSKVDRRSLSVYDLDREEIGSFDFAVVGTLLWHLRDPAGALAAVAGVLDGRLLLNEGISLSMTVQHPFHAAAQVMMHRGRPFWYAPNRQALERMVIASGLDIAAAGRPYIVPHGPGVPWASRRWILTGGRLTQLPERFIRARGALHAWVLAGQGPRELTGAFGARQPVEAVGP